METRACLRNAGVEAIFTNTSVEDVKKISLMGISRTGWYRTFSSIRSVIVWDDRNMVVASVYGIGVEKPCDVFCETYVLNMSEEEIFEQE